jgi:hypothetical protein
MKKNILIIILIVAFVAVGAGSFYAGTKMGGSSAKGSFRGQGMTLNGQSGTASKTTSVIGSITAISDTSMTVKTSNGSAKIIFFSDSTKITKSTEGAKTDLAVGTNVRISGTTETAGVTASTVQIVSTDETQSQPSGEQPADMQGGQPSGTQSQPSANQ